MPAVQLPNDARAARFIGGAPPAGHGPHRYFITVTALDVEDIGVPAEGTPASLGFAMVPHNLPGPRSWRPRRPQADR